MSSSPGMKRSTEPLGREGVSMESLRARVAVPMAIAVHVAAIGALLLAPARARHVPPAPPDEAIEIAIADDVPRETVVPPDERAPSAVEGAASASTPKHALAASLGTSAGSTEV